MPTVQEDAQADFDTYIPSVPADDFAWRFYGTVSIYAGGAYTFCATSDDGSLVYLNIAAVSGPNTGLFQPGTPENGFTLIIDNDGLHGPQRICRVLQITSGDYITKV